MEIKVHLRFLTPCLGRIRGSDGSQFSRDTQGNVIFMNSWWRRVLEFGAQAIGRYQRDVAHVRVHPRVAGHTETYRRYYGGNQFTAHEAFLANTVVQVRMLIPSSIPLQDFREILRVTGSYRGISPYGWQHGYGHFEVLACETLEGHAHAVHEGKSDAND